MVLSETIDQKLNYTMRRLFLLYKDVCGTQGKGNSRFQGLSASGVVYPPCFWRTAPKLTFFPFGQLDQNALSLRPILP